MQYNKMTSILSLWRQIQFYLSTLAVELVLSVQQRAQNTKPHMADREGLLYLASVADEAECFQGSFLFFSTFCFFFL